MPVETARLTVKISGEGGEPTDILARAGEIRQSPLHVDVPLAVTNDKHLARLAFLREGFDVIRDVFGSNLSVAQGAGR